MTETTSAPTPPMGLFARAIGVLTSPGATFKSVIESPRPFGILLLVALVIGLASTAPQFTETGRQATLDMQVQTIERMTGQSVSDEMYQQIESRSRSPFALVWSVVGTLVGMPIVALFFTALYWAIFNAVLGGTASFKQVLGIVTHSMVIMAIGTAAAMLVQTMTGKMTMTGPFHLGALVPMLAQDSFLARFLSGMNLFTLWQIVVIAIGLGVLYRKKAGSIAVTLFVLYGVLVAAFVTVFSRFTNR